MQNHKSFAKMDFPNTPPSTTPSSAALIGLCQLSAETQLLIMLELPIEALLALACTSKIYHAFIRNKPLENLSSLQRGLQKSILQRYCPLPAGSSVDDPAVHAQLLKVDISEIYLAFFNELAPKVKRFFNAL